MAKKKSIKTVSLALFAPGSADHEEITVVCRILIVCEGEKTEPNYFSSFSGMKRGGTVYEVKCEGGKINTIQVVEKAIELRDRAAKAGMPYDSVWAVFDKDSFPARNFNAAISKAKDNGIECAWSNEAFELWYVFHFAFRNTPMSRKDYQKAITGYLSTHLKGYSYKKNDPEMHRYLTEYGNEVQAIKFAEKQAESFDHCRYAEHEPSTWVYKLVKLLRGEDKDFNRRIKSEVNRGNA